MCMDEFVKRLYDCIGIYRIFGVKIIITDILPIFFQKFQYMSVR